MKNTVTEVECPPPKTGLRTDQGPSLNRLKRPHSSTGWVNSLEKTVNLLKSKGIISTQPGEHFSQVKK